MKKKFWIGILTAVLLLNLLPGMTPSAAADDTSSTVISTWCYGCGAFKNFQVIGFIPTPISSTPDPVLHWATIKCLTCGNGQQCSGGSTDNGGIFKHTGGTETPTCTTGKTCEKCGAEYGILGHKWKTPANASLGNGTHRIICLRCGLNGTASCTGGTATCTTKAVCEACGGKYGKRNLNNHALVHYDAQAPTCTKPGWDAFDTCPRCYYTTFRAIPALKHDLEHHEAKAPTCTEKGWDAYEACSRFGCDYTTRKELPALNHALEQHEAQAPTCTEIGWDAYETCSRCDYTTYVELPALGHDYQEEVIPRTCEQDGFTLHTCLRCGDDYTDNMIGYLGHWYGEWTANGDGTQRAECLRGGCHHEKTVDCEIIELPALNISLCPVCGTVSDGSKPTLANASVKIISGRIPHGEALLRVGTLANGEKLLTVGYVYGGRLSKASCQVRIALPAELVNGYTLSLLNADGTETPLEYALEGDSAVLTLTFAQSLLAVRLTPAP